MQARISKIKSELKAVELSEHYFIPVAQVYQEIREGKNQIIG